MQSIKVFTIKRIKKIRTFFITIIIMILVPTIMLALNPTSNAVVISNFYFNLMSFVVVAYLVDLGIGQSRIELRECLQLGYNRRTFIISRLITVILGAVLLALILTPISKYVNSIGLVYEPDSFIPGLLLVSHQSFFGTMFGYSNLTILIIITSLGYLFLSLLALVISLVFLNQKPKRYIHLLIGITTVSFGYWLIDTLFFKARDIDMINRLLGFGLMPNQVNIYYPIMTLATLVLILIVISYNYVGSIEL